MARALTLSTRSTRGLAARFYKRDKVARAAIQKLVRATSTALREDVAADCPKDTYFMMTHIVRRLSEKGLAYEVGWDEADFTAEGFAFYPVYVIFGTRFQDANDFFFPLRDKHDARFREGLRRELSAAIARGRAA